MLNGISDMADQKSMANAPTVREVLRLFWEADRYPMLGNEDRCEVALLEHEACAKAMIVVPSRNDPPEFVAWLNALRNEKLRNNEREVIMVALYELFDPEDGQSLVVRNAV